MKFDHQKNIRMGNQAKEIKKEKKNVMTHANSK
jgi:hypothetical protein